MSANIFKIVNYQANAFIIVEGKKEADAFFIIRQGKVRLGVEIPVPGEEPYQVLGPGDFFGVVSCMSSHPHIEQAQTLTPVSLIMVGRNQFGTLIQKNAPIAMKIIRYFSLRLRIIDKALIKTKHSDLQIVEENPQEMFKVGEFYFSKNEMKYAAYAYQRYLQFFPSGSNVSQAKMRLQSMNAPFQAPPAEQQNLTKIFQDGQMIFVEHEPGNELFIIQDGSVKITKMEKENEVLLAVLQPSDIFGEMALLENKPRSASASAHGKVVALAINKANFEGMVQAQPQLAVKLINILSDRIWTAYRQLANLLIRDSIGRMYDMLLTLVQKKKVPITAKATYSFDIGGPDLINMLGFDDDKGENFLIQLLSDKNIKLNQGKFFCVDLEDLEKQVQFYRKKAAMERKRDMGRSKLA